GLIGGTGGQPARLNRFIEGLPAADRPDPSQPLSFRPVRLEDMVRAGLTRAGTLTRDHHLAVDLQSDIPALSVDPAAVAEVIYILLDNASKYSPPGTTIRLTGGRGDERQARVTVTDEGPGIPEALRERVFEKFFRIPGRDPVDPRLPRGIGLGLPIARRLVEAQGGQISIERPASGRGTTFVLTLPVATAVRDE